MKDYANLLKGSMTNPTIEEQREKGKLRLQIRLIAAGACGYKIPNIVELKGENLKRFTYGIFDLYGQTIWNEPRTDSIDTMTDYLFEKGVRAIE